MPDRSSRWLFGGPFDLLGGRRPKPGFYEGVPLRTHLPAWLTEIAITFLKDRGIVIVNVAKGYISTSHPGSSSEFEMDAVDFSYDEDLRKLRRALAELHRHAEGLC